ncbi:MAG TPA: hypothetical protein G4N98_10720 [Thermoflexia bacterium]|nr:hypothetical protein [Thermoflexia bacterium]
MSRCKLDDCLLWNSADHRGAKPTCSVSDVHSKGYLRVKVDKSDEILKVYDLEKYFGLRSIKRPDRLLLGRVSDNPWVVAFVEVKSNTGWKHAVQKFQDVLPEFSRSTRKGETHHAKCASLMPDGEKHRVLALIVGHVGRERSKHKRRGNRRVSEREKAKLSFGGKSIPIVPPINADFDSLRKLWQRVGVLP